ncbi:hypothetical protein WJX84_003698 [Apatococcus fuscideae]|uniref:ACT domain-containing protein n=1 Tax=Apatococcus fuscideae TaxID=2026836 RepID=A0AAW1THD6_9CHLO
MGTSVFGEDPTFGGASELDDETISIRRLPGTTEESPARELRISCPDATGLGCDISRMLLDFGISIVSGDVSTDGKWCFLIFEVELANTVPPRWGLLRQRLEHICPLSHSLPYLMRMKGSQPRAFQHPFLLRISASDRKSVLHSLALCLMEADVTVFKARIRTNKARQVKDEFWVYDNRCELPDEMRATQIQNQVRGFLKQVDATLEIEAAPSEAGEERDPGAELMQRSACKDATPSPPLRSLLAAHSSSRRHHTLHHPSPTHSNPSSILNSDGLSAGIASTSSQDSLQDGAEVHAAAPRSAAASPSASGESQHGTANGQGTCSSGRQNVLAPVESPWVANEGGGVGRPPSPLGSSASTSRRSSLDDEPLNGSLNLIDGPLEVTVDNSTASSYSSFIISCPNRKGLMYDLFRTFTDVQVRVAYGKLAVKSAGRFEAELFVQEVDGARILDLGMQAALVERVKRAVQQPVDIRLHDLPDDSGTQLIIAAPLDSGGRGRPRVMYDVSAAVVSLELAVQQADIKVQPIGVPITPDCCSSSSGKGGKQGQAGPGQGAALTAFPAALSRPLEVHCFLICHPSGGPVSDPATRRALWSTLRDQLAGTCSRRSGGLQQAPSQRAKLQNSSTSFHRWKKY